MRAWLGARSAAPSEAKVSGALGSARRFPWPETAHQSASFGAWPRAKEEEKEEKEQKEGEKSDDESEEKKQADGDEKLAEKADDADRSDDGDAGSARERVSDAFRQRM